MLRGWSEAGKIRVNGARALKPSRLVQAAMSRRRARQAASRTGARSGKAAAGEPGATLYEDLTPKISLHPARELDEGR